MPSRFRVHRLWARSIMLPLLDVVAVGASAYLAIALRFEDPLPVAQLAQWSLILVLPLVVRPLVNRLFSLYAHSWRHVSVPELLQLTGATLAGSVFMVGGVLLVATLSPETTAGFPRSFWIIEGVLSLGLMGTVRLVPRILIDVKVAQHGLQGTRAILYGAGEAGAIMARGAARLASVGISPVAFLDDNERKWGKFHAGVPVRGDLDALARVVADTDAHLLLITMPTASGERVRTIADAAAALNLQIRTTPALEEMLNGRFDPSMVRPLQLEDLLRRPPVTARTRAELAAGVVDDVVLVTGAGGSIGAELARQLFDLEPRRLVLLDRAEGPLYEIQRDIEQRRRDRPIRQTPVEFHVGDVASPAGMARLLEASRPSLIFHAAAYKHVPVMERNPASAVEVNVGGTLALLQAADERGVERFVLVSTDKAVEPENVMGATKRLAELLVAEYSAANGRRWVSVRFGNVLGSSGSVVPIFQQQLKRGEPLTVTDEEMTRYFMTIPEAVQLILQSANIAAPGDLFVLDMGKPVRIVDLAHDLLRLQGVHPSRARIEFTGLRPGEKLHERLFNEHESVVNTSHRKVFRVRSGAAAAEPVTPLARQLVELARAGDDAAVRQQLMAGMETHREAPAQPTGEPTRQSRHAPGALPLSSPPAAT